MSTLEFVRRLLMFAEQEDTHYAFWLGAGCSVSSGIPGAGSLVLDRWLPKLQQVSGEADQPLAEWAKTRFPDFDENNPAAIYGAVMEGLFIQEEARQREVEELCEGRDPGFGYAVLAALMARQDGLFNVALTTNFDDLVGDAMYLFTRARPLVIGDEALASYIRPSRLRPLVVKVHGDHRLSPRNTAAETGKLESAISESVCNLLHDRGVIFLGYGGNDVGIAQMFQSLPDKALPLGIWWASRREPEGALREWLERRNAIWVKVEGFDELMLTFKNEFEIPHPTQAKFERVFSSYLGKFSELEDKPDSMGDTPSQELLEPGDVDEEEGWVDVYVRSVRLEAADADQAEELLKEGLGRFPKAIYLWLRLAELQAARTRHADAIASSGSALDVDPENVTAIQVHGITFAAAGQPERAQKLLERALEIEPRSVLTLGLLGLIAVGLQDLDLAKHQLELAFELQPSGAPEYGLLADLADEVGMHELAEGYHERAIREAPDKGNWHANYARCLIALGRTEDALRETNTALELLPAARVATRMEANFYRFVLDSKRGADEALAELEEQVKNGATIPSWGLQDVVRFAEDAGHPETAWIRTLAEVLNARAEPSALDEWPRWQEAA